MISESKKSLEENIMKYKKIKELYKGLFTELIDEISKLEEIECSEEYNEEYSPASKIFKNIPNFHNGEYIYTHNNTSGQIVTFTCPSLLDNIFEISLKMIKINTHCLV